jgi:hypothetical protein
VFDPWGSPFFTVSDGDSSSGVRIGILGPGQATADWLGPDSAYSRGVEYLRQRKQRSRVKVVGGLTP